MGSTTSTGMIISIIFILCSASASQISHSLTKNEHDFRGHNLVGNICPDDCNTNNCKALKCARCEFACGGQCTYKEEWKANAPSKPQDPMSTICPIATFEDITPEKFADTFWYNYPHPGVPTQPETAPVFVDLNGDGLYDFHTVSHNRAHAESVEVACSKDEPAGRTCYKLQSVRERIQMTHTQADSHGSNIVDLDSDGIPDLIIAVGGGLGGSKGKDPELTENTLLWGEIGANGEIIFKGGRDASAEAGVSMRSARGRFNYIFDANGDGLLDIFFAADRPKVNALAPGALFINNGDRTWRRDNNVTEYSTSMLLTDVDKDGFANELVIARDLCYPQTTGPYPLDALEFCRTRPLGTTAVYKFNSVTNQMEDIGKHYFNSIAEKKEQPPCCKPGKIGTFTPDNKNCYVRSTASGDFDGDLIADQVFLYTTKINFYFSSERPAGTLPFGGQWIGAEIFLPLYCTGKVLRIVDLDNDGREEVVVGCYEAGKVLVYTQGKSKSDWTIENGCNNGHALGDINNFALAAPNKSDYEQSCNNTHSFAKQLCRRFQSMEPGQDIKKLIQVKLAGISVVDIDNDGFSDFVLSHLNGHTRFFRNIPSEEKKQNRFIAIKLVGGGVGSGNVYGIGATIILYADNCDGCEEQMREVSSHQHATDKWGYQDERIIFGLGMTGNPFKAVVRWPSGSIQTNDLSSWKFSTTADPVFIHEESCKDGNIKFTISNSRPLGCRYVNKYPSKKQSRCRKITDSGKPASHFCPKSCGNCK